MKRLIGIGLSLALLACSSSGDSTGPSTGLSADAAEAFSSQVARALGSGLQSTNFARGAAERFAAPLPGLPIAAVPVNVSVKQRTNCTAGGYIEVSGTMTGNISDQGSGVLQLQVLETISDWRCIGNHVINGDPYISAAGTFTFLNGVMGEPAQVSIGGAFKWGNATGQGCNMQLTILMYRNGTGRVSGQTCGHIVNEQF